MDFSANQSLEAITAGMSHAALGKLILDYIDSLPPAQLQATMHDRAAETLAEIYDILEDPDLDAPHALQKIEAIVSAYFSHLGVRFVGPGERRTQSAFSPLI